MADVEQLLTCTLRTERGRILAALLRLCGSLDDCEDALQEAATAALQAWRGDCPSNPGAWLLTTARNCAKDARRRRVVADAKAPLLVEPASNAPETPDTISDDYLRLLFTCCHPELSLENQIALTLKVIAGFTTAEIARAFMCSEATLSQRVLRAKQTLEAKCIPYMVPERSEVSERVLPVLGVLYAMFNEGHTSSGGPWMRLDLQAEALRLARLLCDLAPNEPEVFATFALMAFSWARAPTRVDSAGLPVLLPDQDRSRWDRTMIREGLMALARARTLRGNGTYVWQAEIAALHATAPDWESTNWAAILARYDALDARAPSPLVKLNRAIALSMLEGPEVGLAALQNVAEALANYHLFYAVRADLLERAGADPTSDLRRALELVRNDGERRLLERRLANASPIG